MSTVLNRGTLNLNYLLLGVLGFTALFPIVLMVLNSFKTSEEIVTNPMGVPSDGLQWINYSNAWEHANFSTTFVNSLTLTLMTIVLVCGAGAPAAYVLAHKKIRRWRLVTGYLLATTTAPIQLFLFPLYFGYAKLGLINNVFAVSVIYAALFSPFAILLLRTYFLAVPSELEEAARIDGASHWQVFTRVMLPIVSPGILTVALIVGLYTWNEFLIATTFLQSKDNLTAVVSFVLLSGTYSSDWGEIMAAAMIIVVPVVIFFVFMQRRFIEGMAGGSVKG